MTDTVKHGQMTGHTQTELRTETWTPRLKERIKLIELSLQLVKNPENLPFVTLAVTAAQEGVSGLSLVLVIVRVTKFLVIMRINSLGGHDGHCGLGNPEGHYGLVDPEGHYGLGDQ